MTDDALQTWRDKLAFLEKEEALAVDAEQKFALRKRIEEARQKIAELEEAGSQEAADERPSYADEETERLSIVLEQKFEQKERLILADQETRDLDREILDIRRLLRKGPQLQAGEILADGRFKLIDVLGKGGFATVWKAYDRRLRQPVAVKVLHGQHLEERTKRERFFRGARRMAQLSHPHIVRVIEEQVEDEGWLFFVMEYVAGGDLQKAVLEGVLSKSEKIDLILQVGQALSYAHGQGIVHRDVKPANVLVDRRDGQWIAKLTDFDLVRAEDSTGFTQTQAMMGTLLFAAPETLASARDAGPSADVYSLGSTAVFVLRGEALPSDYYRDPRPTVASLDASDALKRVLGRAVALKESVRLLSVSDFCRALESAARSVPETVSEESEEPLIVRHRTLQPRAKRPRGGVGSWVLRLALAGFVLGALAYGASEFLSTQKEPGTGSMPEDPSRVTEAVEASRPETEPDAGDLWDDPATQMRFRYIPGGRFRMGSPPNEAGRFDDETLHDVELTRGFWMGETEVTQGQWRRLMGNNPSQFSSCGDDCPVETVSWWGAVAFANQMSQEAGLDRCYELIDCQGTPGKEGYVCSQAVWAEQDCEGYRLPTEAEWERAARAGTDTPFWAGESLTAEQANYSRHYEGTVKVRSFDPNLWGLYEVHGNVWEWVWDYGLSNYPTELVKDPVGPLAGARRVHRGGSWYSDARYVRAAYRDALEPGYRLRYLGFRLSRGPEKGGGAQLGA